MTSPSPEPAAEPTSPSLLVTVTGADRTGVTALLFGALHDLPVVVVDVEQVVVRGHLVLGVVLDVERRDGAGPAPVDDLEPAPGAGTGLAAVQELEPAPGNGTGLAAVQDLEPAPGAGTGLAAVQDLEPAPGAGTGLAAVQDLEPAVREAVQRALGPWDLTVRVRAGAAPRLARRAHTGRAHVTVLGFPLTPGAMAAVARRIAEHGANIDRIDRLAAYPVTCVELQVSGADLAALRASLATEAAAQQIDLAVEAAGLQRRTKQLVVMDVDSTLIQGEVIEMLAARAGVLDEVARITDAAMRGDLDFAASLHRRVALLAGLTTDDVAAVRNAVTLTPGARTLVRTLKRLDYRLAVVSGGFTQITDGLVAELALDYSAANVLEVVDGRLTGNLVGPVVDRAGKAAALRQFAADAGVPLSRTVAIGDGANDLDMLDAAGLGVAFNAKPVVRAAADTAVNVPFLDAVLYLLGITREEIEAADAADGLVTPAPPLP